jgi:starch synthase
LSGKVICKAALQERLGLDVSVKVPLFGIVSRFAAQKGFNLLRDALPQVLDSMNVQLAVLGTGDPEIEDFFRGLQSRYPTRVGAHIGFSNEMSHLIEAGSDFFLMPSLYEPCGLNQSYSMRYGTLPIVRATGGLDDTVHNYDETTGAGTGFKFTTSTPVPSTIASVGPFRRGMITHTTSDNCANRPCARTSTGSMPRASTSSLTNTR